MFNAKPVMSLLAEYFTLRRRNCIEQGALQKNHPGCLGCLGKHGAISGC
jgi:hypothetical protein